MLKRLGCAAAAAVFAACGPVDTSGSGATGTDGGATIGGGAAPDAGASGAPASTATIRIAAPEGGEDCKVSSKGKSEDHPCTVKVNVSGAVLAAPGQCGGSSGTCGHIDFFIDGTACGSPNVQTATTTFDAQPLKCPNPSGQHAFSCELRDDRGNRLASSQTVAVRVELDD